MKPKTREQIKEEAKRKLKEIYPKLDGNENLKGKIRTYDQALEALEDEERFDRFVKLKESLDERREQTRIFNEIKASDPERFRGVSQGPFQRCLEMFLLADESPKSRAYNEKIMDKYCTIAGRAEMVKEALTSLMQMRPKQVFESAGNASEMAEQVADDPLLYEQAFLIEAVKKCPELDLNDETKEFLDAQTSFFETFNGFKQCEVVLGSELNFLFDTDKELPDIDVAMMINPALGYTKGDELYSSCEALVTAGHNAKDCEILKNKIDEISEIDFNESIYTIKPTDKEGKEISLDSIVSKEANFAYRSEEELELIEPTNYECILESLETDCVELRDAACSFNAKKKPGFFSRLFNTQYNKDWKAEKHEIEEMAAWIKSKYGMSDAALDQLCQTKNDSNKVVKDAMKDVTQSIYKRDFGRETFVKKEAIEVKEAAVTEKQEASVKDNELQQEKQMESSPNIVNNNNKEENIME